MKNLKKKLAVVSAIAMAGAMLTACGESSSSSTSTPAATTAAANDSGDKADDSGDTAAADNSGDTTAADNSGDTAAADNSGDTAAAPAGDLTDDGDKLTILCWTPDDMEPMIKLFCEEKGYSADQVTWTKCGDNGSDASEKYEQFFAGTEDVDLFVAEADWILKYINMDDIAAPLSALGVTEDQYKDAYPYTVAIGKDNNGVLKGASWQAAAGGYVYRSDLAEQYLDVHSPDEMQAKVSDWDKFKETAAAVKEASGGKTAMTATIGGMWQVFAANRSEPWVKDNKLVLDNAADFVNLAKEMSDNGYVTGVSQWASDGSWYAIGQDDSTMGYFLSTWGIKDTEGSVLYNVEGGTDGATYGKYNLCVGPTNYFWGGSWLVPSTRCNNKTMAKEFVDFFTNDAATMQKYAEATGEFVNNKSAMQAIVDAGTNSNSLLGGQDHYPVLIDAADGIKMDGLITPYDASIKSKFIDSVNNYISGTTDSADATIEAFQDAVAASYPNFNWD